VRVGSKPAAPLRSAGECWTSFPSNPATESQSVSLASSSVSAACQRTRR
jgi:hypothetical protein